MRKSILEVASLRRVFLLGMFSVAVLALLTSGGTLAKAATTKATTSVVVSTKTLPKLGTVLVNAKGLTLYMFVPDKHAKVTCVGGCAVAWPPVMLPAGAKAVAAGSAKASLLGSDSDPKGGKVVTYAHWPLYTYVGDTKPGAATGQGLNVNGGLWYVLSPSGTVIKTSLASKTTTTSKSSKGASADGCPAGKTIQSGGANDQDADNFGGADDFDGCL